VIIRLKPIRIVVVLAFAGAVLTGIASAASAHSELISTDPEADSTLSEAPSQVELTFGEPVQEQGSIILVTLDGAQVSKTNTFAVQSTIASIQLKGPGDPGTYNVEYRVVSEDGHVVEDSFSYTVEGASKSGTTLNTSTPSPTSAVTDDDSDESTGTVVWILGAGAIGLVLVAALIAVAMRGRRGRSS
jgi:methionine-rich copper-binding protein CopC